MANDKKLQLLIVEARFYDDLADALLDGAKAALDAAGAAYDVVTVPGALEIPAVISFALDAADDEGTQYDGYVALGTVIRGETYHFDIVANESCRAPALPVICTAARRQEQQRCSTASLPT